MGTSYYVFNSVKIGKYGKVKIKSNSIYVGGSSIENGIEQFVEISRKLSLKLVIVSDSYLKDIITQESNVKMTG